jgi:hypothetical protein
MTFQFSSFHSSSIALNTTAVLKERPTLLDGSLTCPVFPKLKRSCIACGRNFTEFCRWQTEITHLWLMEFVEVSKTNRYWPTDLRHVSMCIWERQEDLAPKRVAWCSMTMQSIWETFHTILRKSVHWVSLELGLSHSTVHYVLHSWLKLQAHRLQLVQNIT